jgi:hypothetical protein
VIITASVLVIRNHQKRSVPGGACTDGLPDPEKEFFSSPDITIIVGMVVIGASMMGVKASHKLRFDKRVSRQFARF